MVPIRGLKRRKKAEKEVDPLVHYSSVPSQLQPSLDWWDEFSKRITGPLFQSKDSAKFESVFKISRRTFNYICSLVKEEMMAKPANFTNLSGKLLSLNDRVAIALRRLSSGESLSAVGDSFGINQSTVSQITWRFVEAMEERGLHHLRWPSTEEDMKEIKTRFEKIRGLPNCCGAIDTTHIMISIDQSNNIWCDKEQNHSMILQAIVDPEMRFRDIVTGWPGSLGDSMVLKSSSFYRLSEEGKRLNGKNMKLSKNTELREYIVGDVAFPLLPWLLTPYRGRGLPDFEANFNRRHFASRMVAQRALARLKETWKIIQGVMWRPDKNRLPRIILVCCLLHNIVIDLEDEVQDEMPMPFSHHHDSDYRQQVSNSIDHSAYVQREKLSLYLCGRLPP
ncbi:unnamed protein product [Ilex paraguariensis]|uniref:DDE Tnp4 domain-containing protein n=1 Tax=Ilex paraguariensis TaxID=185542 RepID=A0ABC8U421_9AQUA